MKEGEEPKQNLHIVKEINHRKEYKAQKGDTYVHLK